MEGTGDGCTSSIIRELLAVNLFKTKVSEVFKGDS